MDVAADLQTVNDQPRVPRSDYALEFWSQLGRTVTEDLKVPTIRVHMLGDWAIPYSLMQGYEKLIAEKGASDLYRQALIEGTGHCEILLAESTEAVETLVAQLETGTWPDTSPEALNSAAAERGVGNEARFIPFGDWRVGQYNRVWLPDE